MTLSCLITGANRVMSALVAVLMLLLLHHAAPTNAFGGGQTCLVTGTSRGIGLELCKQLHAAGNRVIAACRQASPELSALGLYRVVEGVDVTSDEQVSALASALAGTTVDQLWCNAGLLVEDDLDSVDFERMRQQFEVNTLGPLRVTKALLPNLKRGSKVLLVTSRMGSVADNSSGGYYGYRASKSGLNIVGVSLAHDLKGRGISVGILHPGFVKTEMTRDYWSEGAIEPAESVRGLLDRAAGLNLGNSGSFWHKDGQLLPW